MSYQDPFEHSSKIYDLTSRYVPYDVWADHIMQMVKRHGKLKPENVLEISAGTGSFRTYFKLPTIKNYFCSDISLNMIKGAKLKFEDIAASSYVFCQDNRFFSVKSNKIDLCILLFDSINYMLNPNELKQTILNVSSVLKTSGLFIFDFTTPLNSIENMPEDFSEVFEEIESSFKRLSKYDSISQIHTTEFELFTDSGTIFESHIERAYHLSEMKNILNGITEFKIEAMYDEFEFINADEKSQRVHVVLRKR